MAGLAKDLVLFTVDRVLAGDRLQLGIHIAGCSGSGRGNWFP
jgi:hypothetical protein